MGSEAGRVPDEASIRRFSAGATLVLCAAVAGVAFAIERANQRWEEENNPIAAIRARLQLRRVVRHERREMVIDMLRMFGEAPSGPIRHQR
jgi:hypothetical protein